MTYARSLKQRVLNEPVPNMLPPVVNTVQNGIFTAIFAGLEKITESAAKVVLFPAATFITMYNSYLAWQAYKKSRNKNLHSTVSLALNFLATGGEIFAVGLAVLAYIGITLLSAAVVPAVFIATVAINFLVSFAQTIYYGVKCINNWLNNKTFTKEHQADKDALKTNAANTFVLAIVGAAIGALLFVPAFHLASLAAGVVTAIKATAAVVAGLNTVRAAKGIYDAHQHHKELAATSTPPDVNPLTVAKAKPQQPVVDLQKYLDVAPKPTPNGNYSPLCRELLSNYRYDDLIERLNACSDMADAQNLITMLFREQRDNLAGDMKSLGAQFDIDAVLDEHNQLNNRMSALVDARGGFFEKDKRKAKIYALALLERLVNGFDDGIKLKDKEGNDMVIRSVDVLENYLTSIGMGDDVFSAALSKESRMSKLFLAADHYMNHIKDQKNFGFKPVGMVLAP